MVINSLLILALRLATIFNASGVGLSFFSFGFGCNILSNKYSFIVISLKSAFSTSVSSDQSFV